MPVEVYVEPLHRRYVSEWCSVPCALNTLLLLGTAILPLYISHASGNMWIKEAVHFEQPRITYQNRLLVEVHGYRGVQYPIPFTSVWTSSRAANDLFGTGVSAPMIIRSSTIDDNFDGIAEELCISASMPLKTDEVVTSATMIAYVDVDFQDVTRFHMDGMLVASGAAGIPLSTLAIDGDVSFHQRYSLPTPSIGGIFTPFMDTPLPTLDSPKTLEDVMPGALMAASRRRNFTLQVVVPAPITTPDTFVPGSADLSTLATKPRTFDFSAKFRISSTQLVVRPRISEELKWGWVQYLSFLWLSYMVAQIIRWALFGLRVVETAVLVDAPRTTTKLHVA